MNQVVETKKQAIADVRGLLEKMKPQMESALPRHLTADRLARVAVTAIQQNPKLLDCDRNSLLSAIMSCAQLGLEPDGLLGQAYLIPFKVKGSMRVQFIPGYKGLIDLARRSGDVSSITAVKVCENDHFVIDYSNEPPFEHKPLLKGDRGEAIVFWAMARFKDGSIHWDYMTRAEVEAMRDGSQGYQAAKRFAKNGVVNSPWVTHFDEMAKKTVIRRICKYLPMSVSRAAAIEDAYESGKATERTAEGDFIVINAESDDGQVEENESGSTKLEQFTSEHDLETGEVIDQQNAYGNIGGDSGEDQNPPK